MTSKEGFEEALRRVKEAKKKNLDELDLQNLNLKELPEDVFELKNLKRFNLYKNTNLAFPIEIINLKNLEIFDFSNLNGFPKEILELKNLKFLGLLNGEINKIPENIDKLENLETLHLTNNKLSSLPKSLLNLKKLKYIDLKFNPKLKIPDEILGDRENPQKILNYYFENIATDKVKKPINEVKMLIVGQGAVGKTSLVNRIVNDSFNPSETKTDGILVKKYNSNDVRVNIWDFGGQEIYHSTHQFFLTKRSIYLIVISARDGEEQGRLEYWLKMVSSFGGDSPIIIVINKIDEHNIDLNERGLKEKYKNIKEIVKVSCKNGKNIDELKKAINIEIDKIPHIKDELVLSWFNVKNKLENMREDFISYDEYIKVCENEGIEDKISQETLIGFLHDLGIVLNFRDDRRLKDVNVLNPEWITKSIYKIIDSNILFNQKGEVSFSDLEKILENYTDTKIEYIINIMKKFELCFDFEDDKFLIPELLQKEESYIEFNKDESLRFEYHYSILPLSVISRFIVRVNTLILQKTYWQSGVLLIRNGNKAIVKADLEDKKIFIWINGKTESRRKLLSIIRSNFEHIHSTISKLEIKEVIPIPNYNASIDYLDLVDLENQSIEEYYYPKIKAKIKVSELLNGLETKEEREAKHNKDRNILENIEKVDKIKTDKKLSIFEIIVGIATIIGVIYTIFG